MGEVLARRGATRRALIGQAGATAASLLAAPAWAQNEVALPFASGPRDRPMTTAFPQKAAMILQRTRPPLLETPFEVFDQGVFTPNDRHYVRWHWAVIPTEIDVGRFRLAVHGHVERAGQVPLAAAGAGEIRVRCTNANGLAQPEQPTWNPSGFMHNSIERTALIVT